jgi:hypothetical protein
MKISKVVNRLGHCALALVLSSSLLIQPSYVLIFPDGSSSSSLAPLCGLFVRQALDARGLQFYRPRDQSPAGLQLLETEMRLAESQAVGSLRGILENLELWGVQIAEESFKQSLETLKNLMNALVGAGLNEVDKDLMTRYFQALQPEIKQRFLAVRELLFARGHMLAGRGMASSAASIKHPGETAHDAAMRIVSTLNTWREWALLYAAAHKRDYTDADEKNLELTGKSVTAEIEEDIYQPLLKAATEIASLARQGEIDPSGVTLKLSRAAPEARMTIHGRSARVGFLPMKGDPWQVGHIFSMLEAIAEHRLDKLVIMVDNSDPERKPNLSSLTIREPITLELLKILEPFVEYTPISKEEADLRKADGERSIFRLMQFNRNIPISWFYMGGSDHRHWEIQKKDGLAPDTAKKIHGYKEQKADNYLGEELGIIFMERKGEEFKEGEMDSLREKSGINGIYKIRQPMDTSSTRVRKYNHWWTVPYTIFVMAEFFWFWGAEKASRIDRDYHRFGTSS